jgi:biopolymer transport protein ExbD
MAFRPNWSKKSVTIDVTPLVNVALILLIVFMIVTPMMRQGVQVSLPPAEHGADSTRDQETKVVLSVRGEGDVYVDLKQVDPAHLEAELTHARLGKEDVPVVIKADKALDYGDVLRLMYACRNVGVNEVELMAKKTDGR